MARGKVTQDIVNALQAGPSDHFLWDDRLAGFGVKVTPKSAKVYILQYRMGGRGSAVRRYTIGPEGKWRAASARKEAERLAVLIGQGVDVVKDRKARAAKVIEERALAFDDYLEAFAETTLKAKWPRSWKATHNRLKLHATPFFKSKPLPDISRDDLRAFVRKYAGQAALARNLWASLSFMFNEAVKADHLAESPMRGLEPPKAGADRDHFLNGDELRWLWGSLSNAGAPYDSLMRLLIVLGQRRNEVSELPWAELDRKALVWSLPAERSKNGEASMIPLPPVVVAELDRLAGGDKWPRRGLVFSSRKGTAISGFSKMKLKLDKAMKAAAEKEGGTVRPWTLHDLRRTLATNLQALGVDFAVTEHLLNHKEKTRTGIAKVYQRHGYLAEKRAALERWESEINRIVAGREATIIPLRRA